MSDAEREIVVEQRGELGHIALNRPRAINAINQSMVEQIQWQLEAWRDDDSVKRLALTGNGDRGFCAGGDIVSLYHDARSGDGSASERFWRDEYRLDAAIANYPKQIVAFQDGIVLGGGIGLSGHSGIRVVTERSRVGMPETGIGFIPDVGGLWLLTRGEGELGALVALAGSMITAADAIAVNLSDYYVPSDALPALMRELETTDARLAVEAVAQTPPGSPLDADRGWIDEALVAPTAADVIARLRAAGSERANLAADTIESKSPTMVAVTLEALRRARRMATVEEALDQDLAMALIALRSPDFVEGVRAQVIDKDRRPRWAPATLAEVAPERVQEFFVPPSGGPVRW